MRFFEINPRICRRCDECMKCCPVNSIVEADACITIDYDMCIACGICFKMCPSSAVEININVDKIRESVSVAQEMKNQNEQINQLEEENKSLKIELHNSINMLKSIVGKLPFPVIVVDNEYKVASLNDMILDILSFSERDSILNHGISNVYLNDVMPEEVSRIFMSSIHNQRDIVSNDVKINGVLMSVSVYIISKSSYAMGIFKNLYDEEILKEEVCERLQSVIDQNMSMIQKIGFLMGEETSKTTKTLNSIIKSLNTNNDVK